MTDNPTESRHMVEILFGNPTETIMTEYYTVEILIRNPTENLSLVIVIQKDE